MVSGMKKYIGGLVLLLILGCISACNKAEVVKTTEYLPIAEYMPIEDITQEEAIIEEEITTILVEEATIEKETTEEETTKVSWLFRRFWADGTLYAETEYDYEPTEEIIDDMIADWESNGNYLVDLIRTNLPSVDLYFAVVETEPETEEISYSYSYSYDEYSPNDLKVLGVIYWGEWRFTWYSENVLPGGGLNIPGRWSDGDFVRDENGYICVASSDLSWGTIVDTPWGTARVYDSGCSSGTIDVYTSW